MVPTLNSTRCRHSATATHDTFEGVRGCFYEVVVIRKSRQEEKKADDLERWLLDDNEIMCLLCKSFPGNRGVVVVCSTDCRGGGGVTHAFTGISSALCDAPQYQADTF